MWDVINREVLRPCWIIRVEKCWARKPDCWLQHRPVPDHIFLIDASASVDQPEYQVAKCLMNYIFLIDSSAFVDRIQWGLSESLVNQRLNYIFLIDPSWSIVVNKWGLSLSSELYCSHWCFCINCAESQVTWRQNPHWCFCTDQDKVQERSSAAPSRARALWAKQGICKQI